MDNKINAWLEDILRSIDEIYDFLPEKRDFFEFQKDLKTKKAVERNIEIIGEAVKFQSHSLGMVCREASTPSLIVFYNKDNKILKTSSSTISGTVTFNPGVLSISLFIANKAPSFLAQALREIPLLTS